MSETLARCGIYYYISYENAKNKHLRTSSNLHVETTKAEDLKNRMKKSDPNPLLEKHQLYRWQDDEKYMNFYEKNKFDFDGKKNKSYL